ILRAKEIAALPDDPDQLQERLQMLAAATGGVAGSAAVHIDGFLAQGALPPKSAIREIRVNPDLYSAQYASQPILVGGLIESDTRPGMEALHGGFSWTFNSAALNAREPLAASRAPLSKNVRSAELGVPLLKHRLSAFATAERKV